MFYYLLYNSSFSFIVDNRLFSTVLYGSILYILTHAILNYCKVEILEIINNYFWFIFILDIISLSYGVYQSLSIPTEGSSNNLDVSFNLLKNQINTISTYFNKKNDITISDNTLRNLGSLKTSSLLNTPGLDNMQGLGNTAVPTPRQPLRIPTSTQSSLPTNPYVANLSGQQQSPQTTQQQKHIQSSGFSTPITALRDLEPYPPSKNTKISHIPESNITSDESSFGENDYSYSDGPEESVAGSDVGSIMDLNDFEKSL